MAPRRRELLSREQAFAHLIADLVVERVLARQDAPLRDGDRFPGGIPLGPGKELIWPSEEKENGSSDPIEMASGGSSSWAEKEADRLLAAMRRKKKPKR
jgi:hypothetical protein